MQWIGNRPANRVETPSLHARVGDRGEEPDRVGMARVLGHLPRAGRLGRLRRLPGREARVRAADAERVGVGVSV